MPNIGFWATAGAGGAAAGAYELISTQALTTTATSVTFSSIPSTYTNLQLRIVARTQRAVGLDFVVMQFNGDAGNNYWSHYMYTNGTSVAGSTGGVAEAFVMGGYIADSTATTNAFGATVIDISDYANASKNKSIKAISGTSGGTYFRSNIQSGIRLNTAAISSILVRGYDSSNFIAGSRFSLYGIKG